MNKEILEKISHFYKNIVEGRPRVPEIDPEELASYLSGLEKRIDAIDADFNIWRHEHLINHSSPSVDRGEQYMKDDEGNIIIPCDCGCHTSKSSSEDMKKNGCDYCYSESKYYPRHKPKEPIKDCVHDFMIYPSGKNKCRKCNKEQGYD